MADTHIEWTDRVWNPTTGCDRVSPGCDYCYALTMAKRLKGMGQPKYQNDGDPRTSGPGFLATEHESELDAPLRWRKPAKVFVNSMSDLFHDRISDEFIAEVFGVMALARRHIFQVLTKRHGRMRSLLSDELFGVKVLGEMHRQKWATGVDAPRWLWPLPNVWLGVSVEDQKWANARVPKLLETPAAVRFLSCEPLLGPIDLSPWLPGGRCGCAEESRGRALLGRPERGAGDRPGGSDLACGGPTRGPLGGGDQSDSLHATQGGASLGEVFPGPGDVRGAADTCSGSQAGVAAHAWSDPAGHDDQPPKRTAHGQQAVEPGVGRHGGSGWARASNPPSRQPDAIRGAEPQRAPDDRADSRDLLATGGRGTAACPRCGLRRSGADHLQDREGSAALAWLIVGGESGPGARPMHPDWARSLRDQCVAAGVPYHFKQWGEWAPSRRVGLGQLEPRELYTGEPVNEHGFRRILQRVGKKAAGRELDGRTWDEFPEPRRTEVAQ